MNLQDQQTGLNDVISAALDNFQSQLHTAIPCIVKRYDPATRSGDILPAVKTLLRDGRVLSKPLIQSVPFVMPGGGGAFISLPVQVGDTVLALFSERSIDQWVHGDGSEADPEDYRKHNISDAIAIVGLYPYSKSLPTSGEDVIISYAKTLITIKKSGDLEIKVNGNAKITAQNVELNATDVNIKSGTVELGDGATAGVVLGDKMIAKFNAHTHTGVQTGGGVSGIPSVMLTESDIASAEVKAKS